MDAPVARAGRRRSAGGGAKGKGRPFYEGQLKSAEFYTQIMLPVVDGKDEAILSGCSVAVDIPEDAFGGK
jgi:hypothetical protein